MKRTILVLLAVVGALLCWAKQANADGITYTESGTATGTIGTTNFTNAQVTITFVGDTSNVQNPSPGFYANDVETVEATVDISGIGTFTFTDSLQAFVNQTGFFGATAGINDLTTNDILDTISSSAFSTYNLMTAIGPVTGDSGFNIDSDYNTSDGVLTFSSVGTFSTFTATVPEASSLLLLGVGIAGLGMVRRRLA